MNGVKVPATNHKRNGQRLPWSPTTVGIGINAKLSVNIAAIFGSKVLSLLNKLAINITYDI